MDKMFKMEDMILEEVRRDVFERPKPTIDLDYLYSVKRQVQEFADDTNAQLKKNVYQNYSLFIESSREISTLKEEMRQLNSLLEQQQTAMSKLLDQLNKTPIIQQSIEKTTKINDSFRLELNNDDVSEVEAEILPSWLIKSPEDFDVLIAQRNLKEAVDLAQKVKNHFEQYPKCCENNNYSDLKEKIDSRLKDLVDVICSELQPATDRSVQGGPRSSITSIKLLRELNLSSRAVKLYLDLRSSVLRFVLSQQKIESTTTLQFIKQICSIFFHNIIETCNEFKQAFELDKYINKAIKESVDQLNIEINGQIGSDGTFLFDLIRPIYCSPHPPIDNGSPTTLNGNDISSHILSHHVTDKIVVDNSLLATGQNNRNVFYYLSTYASLTYWTIQEFENFTMLFRNYVFKNPPLPMSMISESIYYLRNQSSDIGNYCRMDMSQFIEKSLEIKISQVIDDCERRLVETIKKLDSQEKWKHLLFENKAQMTRFFDEMNDVNLNKMPKYVSNLRLPFTACKTSFARYYLITVTDLAKVS